MNKTHIHHHCETHLSIGEVKKQALPMSTQTVELCVADLISLVPYGKPPHHLPSLVWCYNPRTWESEASVVLGLPRETLINRLCPSPEPNPSWQGGTVLWQGEWSEAEDDRGSPRKPCLFLTLSCLSSSCTLSPHKGRLDWEFLFSKLSQSKWNHSPAE